jgi:hypothetical protein
MNTWFSRTGSAVALAAGTVLSLGSGAVSAQTVNFMGSTDGCFGMACAPTNTATLDGLSYRDSTFNVTTAAGFVGIGNAPGPGASPNTDNLGSFTLSGSPFIFDNRSFDLLVTFTAPPGTTPGSTRFTAALEGTVVSTDNGGVFINFDNTPRSFTYTGGSFTFAVNDLSLVAGGNVAVTGQLRTTQVSAIPEPETYALMLAGLAAVGFISRRRKKA